MKALGDETLRVREREILIFIRMTIKGFSAFSAPSQRSLRLILMQRTQNSNRTIEPFNGSTTQQTTKRQLGTWSLKMKLK